MSERIDTELGRLSKLGRTAKVIHVGHRLQMELSDEQNRAVASDVVLDWQPASVITRKEVRDYKGIPVVVLEDAEPDYLNIQT
jgi:hypothetical protein